VIALMKFIPSSCADILNMVAVDLVINEIVL